MTLREAEKAVLKAAVAWQAVEFGDPRETQLLLDLNHAVGDYERVKSAGKPKAKCYCGKTVSIERYNLRKHKAWGGTWHRPILTDKRLPTAQPRGGGLEMG